VIKRQFGFTKVRYRGLAKNTAQIVTLSGALDARAGWWRWRRPGRHR
jgi:IS5 family transposase